MDVRWLGALGLLVATSMACEDEASNGGQKSDSDASEPDARTDDQPDASDAAARTGDQSDASEAADSGADDAGVGRDSGDDEPPQQPGELGKAQAECAAKTHTFSEPDAPEFMQWFESSGTLARTVKPAKASDYLMSSSLILGQVHLGSAEIVTIKLGDNFAPIGATVPAGTYTCAANQAGINSSALGVSQKDAVDSACAVTFTSEVVQGGRLEGSFWAYIPPNLPFNYPGGCLVGRFGVTDVEK